MTQIVEKPRSARKALGQRVAAFAHRITTPLVPDDYIDLFNPLWSAETLRGRITAVKPETADAVTLTIRPGRGWSTHVPGQYLRFGVDIDGIRRWRAYSFTSDPARQDGLIEITVKAIPEGLVSNHVVQNAKVGEYVHLSLPEGDFVLPETKPAKILFLTAGSGVTPIMGMLRTHDLDDVVVLHSALTRDGVIFGDELRALHTAGTIRLIEKHTDVDGLLDITTLDEIVPDWRERDVWACGPAGLMAAAEAHWTTNDVVDRLNIERFKPHIAVEAGAGGTVSFTKSNVTKEFDGGKPILDQAEEAGVIMPFGCRMGVCHRCVLPMKSGAVRDLRDGTITTAAPGDGVMIQTCINAAAGPCEIEN
ncbi:ferredoxin reductase [Smaragdicoccus niigatensis]|uniref:ferredoxin reductase n=1 Tax=Smaragdicoccus niigatensis TaxID=359359 RepID=UPI00035FFEF4|nr:ferredoxin reductase [Smaragdicoccus niigatensis]